MSGKPPPVAELNIDRSQWRLVTFGDVAIKQNESVDRETTELTRYVAGEHMGSEDLHLRSWGEIGDDYLGPAFTRRFRKGDILYGSRRTYLRKVAVAHFDGITANTTFVIRANEKLIRQDLLSFLMLSEGFAQHSIRNSKGSVNPYVNWKDIASYEFLLPPISQQSKLIRLLQVGDVALQRKRVLLTSLRAAQDNWFQYISSADTKNWGPLGDVLDEIVAGKSPNAMARPASDSEYGVLKVSAVGFNGYDENENKALEDSSHFEGKYEVKPGFILVTRANAVPAGVGRPCMVHQTRPGLMLSDKTLRLVPREDAISNRILLQNLFSRPYRNHIESFLGGTDAKNISQAKLKMAPIWTPSKNAQIRVEDQLRSYDQCVDSCVKAASCAAGLQKSLINQIF